MQWKYFGGSWILPAFLALAPMNPSHGPSAGEFRLSASNPKASFPLARDRIKQGETLIVVRVMHVENPAQVDFTVTLSLGHCRSDTQGKEIPLGALGLYPKGLSQGRFAFDLDSVWKKIPRDMDSGQFCLNFSLRALRPAEDLQGTQILISNPEWKKPPGI